jgi:TolB-like protein
MADSMPAQRKLAAILAADIAGYSRLMGADEEGTLARLKALRAELIDPAIAGHHGRIVKTTGDGLLVEFASVVDAMRCATKWQAAMADRTQPAETRIEWRIGVNLGDVIIDGDDIFGDGVNIAARLEALAEPGGICISRTVLTQTRGKLDFPVEDLGDQVLKNIAQPVHVFRVLAEPKPMPEPAALPLPDKPSIAVLPFQNMSGDPEQEYFADGMVEEIITALSRIHWLFVIARNSTFTYKGQAVDIKQVGRELGVRYVLEGSVRKGGNRVRITAQLIEAETGTHLWADRFDGLIEDVFELQDQVATSVAGVIEPALQAAEMRRSAERPTMDLTAYDLYLRAWQITAETVARDRLMEAANLLDQAIARDPRFALALATAATNRVQLDIQGAADDPAQNRTEAISLARRCVEAAAGDPQVLCRAGHVLGYFGEAIEAAITLIDRGLALNPSYAEGWRFSGLLRLYVGDTGPAIEHLEQSMRLNPRAQMGMHLTFLGIAYFFDRRFDLAAPKLLAAIQQMPSYLTPYRFLVACYAHMGRLAEAREVVTTLNGFGAGLEPRVTIWRKPEHQQLLLSGLRLAIGDDA